MFSVLWRNCLLFFSFEMFNYVNADTLQVNVRGLFKCREPLREIHSFIWVSDVRVKGKHLARLFNSACWWAVNQAWAFDNMPDCTASHASVCPHKAAHDVTQNWSILINHWPFRGLHWHNSQLIIKIDGHCQKRCSQNNVFIALSFARAWCMTSKMPKSTANRGAARLQNECTR